ncbi:MAG: alpha/beta hydrolase [Anaerolineae bacterium]|nr:alpha/beta hydrolase [Anaerolineae bacterium]MDW8172251.1 alpha/beta hydrolase [Anaerolineae bacterium]
MPLRLPRPTWGRSFAIIGVSSLIVAISFVLWANTPQGALMPEVAAALQDDPLVDVSAADYLLFMPQGQTPTVGYVLYPGGRVQAEAYAPLARAIAERGYLVAIVYVPLNLAFFNVGAAQAVIDDHPEIVAWAVGGHSLGGVASSLFAAGQPDKVRGLVIMASYPANNALANRDDLRVVSIYGTEDGLAKPEDILASAKDLPPGAQFVALEGGNHSQFGWYGDQPGDKPAALSRQEQQARIVEATVDLLTQLES